MVSLAHILTILAVFSAVVISDDVAPGQADSVDEKWGRGNRWRGGFGGGLGLYGGSFCNPGFGLNIPWLNSGAWGPFGAYALFPSLGAVSPGWLNFKAVDSPAVARRSVSIDAEHIFRRRDESVVSCKNGQGQMEHFVPADCHKAVQALVSKKASSAQCKSCAVQLVTPNGKLSVTAAPVEALQRVVDKVLKSCTAGSSSNPARRSPEEVSSSASTKQPFAMIFQKGDGASCDN